VVAAYVHCSEYNAVIDVLHRPGSRCGANALFNDFNDLLKRIATYSAPLIIAGDFNIHMHIDDENDNEAVRPTVQS